MQHHNPYQSSSSANLLSSKHYHSPAHHSPKPVRSGNSKSHHQSTSQFGHQDLQKSNYSRISNRYNDSKQNLIEINKKVDSYSPLRSRDQWNSRSSKGLKDYNAQHDHKHYQRNTRDIRRDNRNSRNIPVDEELTKSKGVSFYDSNNFQNMTNTKNLKQTKNINTYLSTKQISSLQKSNDTYNSPFKRKIEIENRYQKEYIPGSKIHNDDIHSKVMNNYKNYVGSKSSKQLGYYSTHDDKSEEKYQENRKDYEEYNGYNSKYSHGNNSKLEENWNSKYDKKTQNFPYQKSKFNTTTSNYKDFTCDDDIKYQNNSKSRSKINPPSNSYHNYLEENSRYYRMNDSKQKIYPKTNQNPKNVKFLEKSMFDPQSHKQHKQSNYKTSYTTPTLPSSKSYHDLTQFQTSPKLTSIKQFKSVSLIPEKVSINDFSLGKNKGQGKFGAVFCAVHKATGTIYALKRISKEMIKKHNMQSQLALEIKLQLYFNHPNILKLYGFFDDKDNVYLILQYMEEGTLFESLKKRSERIPEKQVIKRIREMSAAIKYLHEIDVAHRDIKPQNIVISYGVSKLCDFGWATICNDRRKTYCGTFDYAAPEILEGKEYDWCVDLWCLGVLTYELLVGKVPFYHISRKQTMKKILRVDRDQLVFPNDISWKAKDFVECLIKKDPEQRMLSEKLLDHPFLKTDIQGKN